MINLRFWLVWGNKKRKTNESFSLFSVARMGLEPMTLTLKV